MRRILQYVIAVGLVLFGWRHYQQKQAAAIDEAKSVPQQATRPVDTSPADAGYRCDGRVYCSQMHSCAEATWFLQNCPGVKMDGEGDGVPCERQWCGHH